MHTDHLADLAFKPMFTTVWSVLTEIFMVFNSSAQQIHDVITVTFQIRSFVYKSFLLVTTHKSV